MSLRNKPTATPSSAPARNRLLEVFTYGALAAAPMIGGCGRVDGLAEERGQSHIFVSNDPCLVDCLEGEVIEFKGDNAKQEAAPNSCVVEGGVCEVLDPNALVDQVVNIKMPVTAECGALTIVTPGVNNTPMPTSVKLTKGVTTFEWKIVGAERGECAGDGGGEGEIEALCHKPVLVDDPNTPGDEREKIGNGEFRVGLGKPVHEPTEEIGARYQGVDGETYCRELTGIELTKLTLVPGVIGSYQGKPVCKIDGLDLDCVDPKTLPKVELNEPRYQVDYTATYPGATPQTMDGWIANTYSDEGQNP